MNFLAHLYLSGKNDGVKIGGFIADSVKGRDYNDYPTAIREGILLHRQIDEFTDKHPLVLSCKHLLRKPYKKYAGIVIDIFFDHFLAVNWSNYSNQSLQEYAKEAYSLLSENLEILPDKVQEFLPFAIKNNWLVLYESIEGIEGVLRRMPNRTSLPQESVAGIKILTDNYNLLRNYFFEFFFDAVNFVEKKHGIILTQGMPSIG
jgi:acyl carrier protein phosphodiesterase